MRARIDGDVQARLDALANRIEAALERVRQPIERPSFAPANHPADGLAAELLREAEARALLQAQRCMALEDQVAALEATVTEARFARAEAEARAEAARREAALALEQLEASHREPVGNRNDNSLDNQLAATLQAKLLEVERLSSELAELRRSNEDLRTRARNHRRELDSVTPKLEQANAQLSELKLRDESNSKRIGELERIIAEQRRELDIAERRAKHMREHMVPR